MNWLGLDIGGANIKLADGRGYAETRPFPLWKRPKDLTDALRQMIANDAGCDRVAVTMTGELADCFQTKTEGVHRILDAAERAAGERPMRVYSTTGNFQSVQEARQRTEHVAASNWHAVARFAGRFAPAGPALFIDIGSTSCDVIFINDGMPDTVGTDDATRLQNGELVYSGVARTPVCGLVDQLPWRGAPCPVAREWFATTRDVYLLTGDVPESPADTDTADGNPATRGAARTRFARMICADETMVSFDEAVAMARATATAQAVQIADGIRNVSARTSQTPNRVIVSGEGEFLALRALDMAGLDVETISLKTCLGDHVSRCAPAHAIAVLAAEEATE